MNDNFRVLNEFVGSGNPKGRFWFIGVEEAGEDWKKPPSEDQLNRYGKRFLPVESGQIKEAAERLGKKYTKIFDIMSKLVLAITNQFDPKSKDWKKYRNEQLLVQDGDTFQANLYPLGRSSFFKKLPEKYQEWFDIRGWYPQEALVKRFDILHKEWREYHPRFTICFGGDQRPDFEKLLGLQAESPAEEIDKCRIYRSGVILCPFFVPTKMSNDMILALAQRLRYLFEITP